MDTKEISNLIKLLNAILKENSGQISSLKELSNESKLVSIINIM
jgi:hypothetical protein